MAQYIFGPFHFDVEERRLLRDGEEIRVEEWGGIRKGSEAFIKNDTFSLIELAKKLE